jgi:hypothetical protein
VLLAAQTQPPLRQLEKTVSSSSGGNAPISVRLQNVTNELRQIQDSLASEKELDPRILIDFRDAVNRVRNTAWGWSNMPIQKQPKLTRTPYSRSWQGSVSALPISFANTFKPT